MRESRIGRNTNETKIVVKMNLDCGGETKIDSGIGFFDHMLELFAKHSGIQASIVCQGDLRVDCHHTVEDIGIAMGLVLANALGDKRGIQRYANVSLPMDEALVDTSLDISGRGLLVFNAELYGKCGDFDNQMVEEFFRALACNAGITLHINVRYGKNLHHIVEGIFKSVARCIGAAIKVVGDEIPSTKGVL